MPDHNNEEPQQHTGVALSLIIGLGGTGHRVLLETRRRLLDKYEHLSDVPIIRFLEVDADPSAPPGYDEEVHLEADIVKATVMKIDKYRLMLDNFPYLRAWLPKSSKYEKALEKDITQGASQIRSRGRFAFAINYADIERKIGDLRAAVNSMSVLQAAEKHVGTVENTTFNIYVVGSLLGGTGSGMFADIAYTIRELIKERAPNQTINLIGMFVIPPAGGVNDRMAANGYASLLELNHWTHANTSFTAEYSESSKIGPESQPPFNYCYLLDTRNDKALVVNMDQLVQMMGSYIFLDLTSDFAVQKNMIRDNLSEKLRGDKWGAPTAYLSYGLSSLTFPRDQMMRICANRLAKDIMDAAILPKTQRDAHLLDEDVATLLTAAAFAQDNLVHSLQGAGKGNNYDPKEQIREKWNKIMVEANDLPNAAVLELLERQSRAFEQDCLNRNEREPNLLNLREEDLGDFLRVIYQRLHERVETMKKWLSIDVITKKMNDGDYRYRGTKEILTRMSRQVEKYTRELTAQVRGVKESLATHQDKMSSTHNALVDLQTQKDPGWMNPGAKEQKRAMIHSYVEARNQYQQQLVTDFAYRAALRFYAELGAAISDALVDMERYDGKMRALHTFFRNAEERAVRMTPTINGRLLYDGRGSTTASEALDSYYDASLAAHVWETVLLDGDLNVGASGLYQVILSGRETALRDTLARECLRPYREKLNQVNVLDLFFKRYGDGREAREVITNLVEASAPFFNTQKGAALPGYVEDSKSQRIHLIGFHNATSPNLQNDAERNFLQLLNSVANVNDMAGMSPLVPTKDQTQVLFLTELGGFPLRVMADRLRYYKSAYDIVSANQMEAPVHSRGDIKLEQWTRLQPSDPKTMEKAWTNFLVLLALGGVEITKETRQTRTGPLSLLAFSLKYLDHQGAEQEDVLAKGIPLLEKLEPGESDHYPKEFHDLVLRMCSPDNPHELSQFGKDVEAAKQKIENTCPDPQDVGREIIEYRTSFRLNSPWQTHINRLLTDYLDANPRFQPLIQPIGTGGGSGNGTQRGSKEPMKPGGGKSPDPIPSSARVAELQKEIARLNALLDDPAKDMVHEVARKRLDDNQKELLELELQGATTPPGASQPFDAAAELDRLMKE